MATTMIRRPLSPRPTGVIEGYPRPGVIIERAVYILSRNKKTAICQMQCVFCDEKHTGSLQRAYCHAMLITGRGWAPCKQIINYEDGQNIQRELEAESLGKEEKKISANTSSVSLTRNDKTIWREEKKD